jgi:O-antigen ligase
VGTADPGDSVRSAVLVFIAIAFDLAAAVIHVCTGDFLMAAALVTLGSGVFALWGMERALRECRNSAIRRDK